jgi:hypothetical protein
LRFDPCERLRALNVLEPEKGIIGGWRGWRGGGGKRGEGKHGEGEEAAEFHGGRETEDVDVSFAIRN